MFQVSFTPSPLGVNAFGTTIVAAKGTIVRTPGTGVIV